MFTKQVVVAKLRVNVKSLVAESKAIRHEIKRVRDKELKDTLAWHRSFYVKSEARSAHLALACAKGVAYDRAEKKCKSQPDFLRITEKIKKMAHCYGAEEKKKFEHDVLGWIQNAESYLHITAVAGETQ